MCMSVGIVRVHGRVRKGAREIVFAFVGRLQSPLLLLELLLT